MNGRLGVPLAKLGVQDLEKPSIIQHLSPFKAYKTKVNPKFINVFVKLQ